MVDKSKVDYDKDGAVTSADAILAKRDLNSDGKIDKTDSDIRARKPQTSTSVTTYGASGAPTKTVTKTPLQQQEDQTKPPNLQTYGVSAEAAQKYDLLDFINEMIDKNVTSKEEFFQNLEQTQFGKDRTNAQEAFDIAFAGPQNEDLQKQIADKQNEIKQLYTQYGVQIDPTKLASQATEAVRSALTTNDIMALIASSFALPTTTEGAAAGLTGTQVEGVSSDIYNTLQEMARSYGVTITDADLQSKVKTAIGQGSGWQSWVEGQRNVFRQQGKNLHPTIANQLDTATYADVMDPYLSYASELLGVSKANLDPMDTTWMTALQGPQGPMSLDEWSRVLKTDPKYGWDRTTKARNEYANLADQITAAFGKA